jgi:hypothetical protein
VPRNATASPHEPTRRGCGGLWASGREPATGALQRGGRTAPVCAPDGGSPVPSGGLPGGYRTGTTPTKTAYVQGLPDARPIRCSALREPGIAYDFGSFASTARGDEGGARSLPTFRTLWWWVRALRVATIAPPLPRPPAASVVPTPSLRGTTAAAALRAVLCTLSSTTHTFVVDGEHFISRPATAPAVAVSLEIRHKAPNPHRWLEGCARHNPQWK